MTNASVDEFNVAMLALFRTAHELDGHGFADIGEVVRALGYVVQRESRRKFGPEQEMTNAQA